MVKQNMISMKQPELGQKILEWRKAKGLTQEELVERCNINVRTIQRIEAGEVTPRAYTIKTILEVLDVNPEEVSSFDEKGESDAPTTITAWMRFSFIAGIVYLIFAVVESVFDVYIYFDDPQFSTGLGLVYSFVKISMIFLLGLFMGGIYKLGEFLSNSILKVVAIIIILLGAMFALEDVISYWLESELILSLVLRSVVSGIVYVFFAIGLLQSSQSRGNLYLVAGAVGMLTGISFLTVIFAIPGLVLLTIFEILLVVLLHKEFSGKSFARAVSFSGGVQAFQ